MLDASVVSEEKRQRTSGIFHDSRAIVCEEIFYIKLDPKSFKILDNKFQKEIYF
jgi:hypothetical protein